MPLTPPQLIFSYYFPLPAPAGFCLLCGGEAFGAQPIQDVLKVTFTDLSYARTVSDVLCTPCHWFMQEQNADLGALLGRGATKARNYSHFVHEGRHYILSKGQKADMAQLFACSIPEVAIIAVSGQKHLAYKARLNPPSASAGWVQFENETLWVDHAHWRILFADIEALYRLGYSKSSIETGRYYFKPKADLEAWRYYETRIAPQRGSGLFQLALFLATLEKEETDEPDP